MATVNSGYGTMLFEQDAIKMSAYLIIYRLAVALLEGHGNKIERVKRLKDNVKKEKIKT